MCPRHTNRGWCAAAFVGPLQEATLHTVRPAQPCSLPGRPPGPRARPVGTALLGLALAGLTACSSGRVPAHAASAANRTAALDATALAAYADRPALTALPPATATTGQVEQALAATLPAPAAIGGHSTAQVGEALRLAAHLVAVTRADRTYLRGPRSASPIGPLSAPTLRTYLTAQAIRAGDTP